LLLIFPAFVLPDQFIASEGHGLAWIVDTRSGRVVAFASRRVRTWRLATLATVGAGQSRAAESARNGLNEQLVKAVPADLSPRRTRTRW
jgi:hypothetical protein